MRIQATATAVSAEHADGDENQQNDATSRTHNGWEELQLAVPRKTQLRCVQKTERAETAQGSSLAVVVTSVSKWQAHVG